MADCAKMSFGLNVLHDNLSFSFSGFNDKMPTYIVEVFSRMLAMKDVDMKHVFDNIKEKLLLDWKNFYLDQTFRQIMPTFRALIYKNAWEQRTLRAILEKFTYEMFKE
jgi:secreted Zn-dependent insulinase-like peptidase